MTVNHISLAGACLSLATFLVVWVLQHFDRHERCLQYYSVIAVVGLILCVVLSSVSLGAYLGVLQDRYQQALDQPQLSDEEMSALPAPITGLTAIGLTTPAENPEQDRAVRESAKTKGSRFSLWTGNLVVISIFAFATLLSAAETRRYFIHTNRRQMEGGGTPPTWEICVKVSSAVASPLGLVLFIYLTRWG